MTLSGLKIDKSFSCCVSKSLLSRLTFWQLSKSIAYSSLYHGAFKVTFLFSYFVLVNFHQAKNASRFLWRIFPTLGVKNEFHNKSRNAKTRLTRTTWTKEEFHLQKVPNRFAIFIPHPTRQLLQWLENKHWQTTVGKFPTPLFLRLTFFWSVIQYRKACLSFLIIWVFSLLCLLEWMSFISIKPPVEKRRFPDRFTYPQLMVFPIRLWSPWEKQKGKRVHSVNIYWLQMCYYGIITI